MYHLLISWFVWSRSLYRCLQFLVLPPVQIPNLNCEFELYANLVFTFFGNFVLLLMILRYAVIKRLKLLQASCRKMHQLGSTSLEHSAEIDVEDFAMKHHKMALLRGRIEIERWEAHSHRWANVSIRFFLFPEIWLCSVYVSNVIYVRVSQCRMKKGLLLTGVGDKVIYKMLFGIFLYVLSKLALALAKVNVITLSGYAPLVIKQLQMHGRILTSWCCFLDWLRFWWE